MDTALDLAETVTLLNYGRVIVEASAMPWWPTSERGRSILAPDALSLTDVHASTATAISCTASAFRCAGRRSGAAGTQRRRQDDLHLHDHRPSRAAGRRDTVVWRSDCRPEARTHLASRNRPGAARPPRLPSLTVRENLIVAAQRRETGTPRGLRTASTTSFQDCASATLSLPARFPAASSRCWQSDAR